MGGYSSDGQESVCNAGDPGSIPGSGRSSGEGIDYPLQYSWASFVAQLVKSPPAMQETWDLPWLGKSPWRRERLPTPLFWPGELYGLYSPWCHKESDTTEWFTLSFISSLKVWASLVAQLLKNPYGFIPELGRCPGEGKGYPLQHSGLENSMDSMVHGITKSQTWLSNFHVTSRNMFQSYKNIIHQCTRETSPTLIYWLSTSS